MSCSRRRDCRKRQRKARAPASDQFAHPPARFGLSRRICASGQCNNMDTNPDQDLEFTFTILRLLFEYGKPDYATQCTIFHTSNWSRRIVIRLGGPGFSWTEECPVCQVRGYMKHRTQSIFGGKSKTSFTPDLFAFLAREDSLDKLESITNQSSNYQIFSFLVWLAKIGPDPLTLATFTCVYRQICLRSQKEKTPLSKRRTTWDWGSVYAGFRREMRTEVHWKWTELFSNRNMENILPLLEAGVWTAQERKHRRASEALSESISKRVKRSSLRRQSRTKQTLK